MKMKCNDTRAFMGIQRCDSLKYYFLLLVVGYGLLILLMATSLLQTSHHDRSRHNLASFRGAYQRSQDLETEEVVNGPINSSKIGSDGTGTVTQPSVSSVTDPSWMKEIPKPVMPFLHAKKKHPFVRDYIIENADTCRNSSVDLLIVMHSAVTNFQRRRILRETWAAIDIVEGITVRRVFLLGRDDTDAGNQVKVNTEYATYRDIVQADFVDSFRNLTRKAVTSLAWINDHCSHARFVLKADDDLFVNVFSLMEHYLPTLAGQKATVMCHAKANNTSIIVRDRRSKWFVPKDILPRRTHWPAFCSGYLVVMTTDVVTELYKASFRAPYIPVDDSFVYGFLPLLVWDHYLRYMDIGKSLTLSEKTLLSRYQDQSKPLTHVGGTVSNDVTLVKLWAATLARLSPWARHRAAISKLHKL